MTPVAGKLFRKAQSRSRSYSPQVRVTTGWAPRISRRERNDPPDSEFALSHPIHRQQIFTSLIIYCSMFWFLLLSEASSFAMIDAVTRVTASTPPLQVKLCSLPCLSFVDVQGCKDKGCCEKWADCNKVAKCKSLPQMARSRNKFPQNRVHTK